MNPQEVEDMELCLMCGGTGEAGWGDHVELCSDCDGAGWLPIKSPDA